MYISHSLCLQAVQAFRGERSVSGLYHLLQGKRSAQTIQDGHIYQALPLFGLLAKTEKERLDQIFISLEQDGYVEKREKEIVITESGQHFIDSVSKTFPSTRFFHGWKFKDAAIPFWRRLSLLIQCLSNLTEQNRTFIPVTTDKDVLEWVKRYLLRANDMKEMAAAVYHEVFTVLEEGMETEAEIFVHRLSGNGMYGQTNEQIADMLDLPGENCSLLFLASLHRMLEKVNREPEKYRALSSLVNGLVSSNLTASAEVTYKYIQQGHTLAEIAAFRKLKENTIEDHIIEIAIEDATFDISLFVSESEHKQIAAAIERASSIRLREIKEFLPDTIPYFKIRLVLAKGGKNVESTRTKASSIF